MAEKTNWVVKLPLDGGEPKTNIGNDQHFMLLQKIAPELGREINFWAANHKAPSNDEFILARGSINGMNRICFQECPHSRNKVYDAVQAAMQGKERTAKKKYKPSQFSDPLKILNMFVARAMNEYIPDEDNLSEIMRYGMGLASVSKEDMRSSLNQIMEAENPAAAIRLAEETKCLRFMLPVVADSKDFWQKYKKNSSELFQHLLLTLDYVAKHSDNTNLRWAALLHDIGKLEAVWVDEDGRTHFHKGPEGQGENHEEVSPIIVRDLFDDLGMPDDMTDDVCFITRNHMFEHFDDEETAKKAVDQIGGVDKALDMLILRGGDVQGKPGQIKAEKEIDEMRELIMKDSVKSSDSWEEVEPELLVILIDSDII